ncbi:hypothetical protein BRARA_C03828 [Brassica rapa]|uniref:BHLH domain-containing protein n=1 Tax=Brassica campestris TaxID=3711 RepID=A0A398A9I7_BRACM|nr:transcription factor bHLH87 [Brassica napus]RID71913.1 hypothetical protein BRARA_C03828 [Brassica rapa]CAG7882909.1 unnamed protein product [Brassica rapa]VDC82155.1 unnamed protein product [Brassica rapa]
MEGLESVYAQAIYGMTRESKIMEHQGSDLIWGGNELSSCFMSDIGIIGETQHHQHVGNRASSIDPSSIDCLLSATTNSNNISTEDDEGISVLFSDCQTLWSFGGVSPAESENREITTETTTTTTKPKSFKRNRGNRDETGNHFCLVGHAQEDSEKGNFKLIYDENQLKSKKPRTEKDRDGSTNISFQQHSASLSDNVEPDTEAIAQMKEMIYTAAAFRPVNLGLETVEKPKRKNVKISTDPQTVAARQRRERVSEKIRVLQNLVPGGSKMDTASMLDEAANYLKFLRAQVKALENLRPKLDPANFSFSSPSSFPLFHPSFIPFQNPNQVHHHQEC